MKLHTLKPAKGAVKDNVRKGRGPGSGKGGTSTRGHKGDKSRSGYRSKLGFEGGQMPLYKRIPKFGFKNPNKVTYHVINVDTLQKLADSHGITSITVEDLINFGLVNKKDKVKILGNGELKASLHVVAHAASESAIAKIQAAGGSFRALE
ncbi:MAG: 50S ribosomal protein L15 [Cytophagales bacterium]|nr:50S ribosomal protein L15 [Cytophagales bacterium]MDW8385247.1 50S ribosomal protein L15 [Flammeovirgaceae bacterium]